MRTTKGRRLDRAIGLAILAASFALAASLSLQKVRTFDYWWHLRTGSLILETGSVPKVDSYTYTVPGARWIDMHWLHQLALDRLYTAGGHELVVVAKAVCAAVLVGLLLPVGMRKQRFWVSGLFLGLMLLVVSDRIMPRPELPSFILLAAIFALLDRQTRRDDAWVFAVVPLQLLWVNLHGLFALGLALCGIFLAAEVLRPLISPGQSLRRTAIVRLGAVLALSTLASLANPNGLDGAVFPLEQLSMIGAPEERGLFGSVISELLPPIGGARPASTFGLALAGTLAALSAGAMLLNWRRVAAAHPLVWVAFGFLGLSAIRNLAIFAIVAAPIAVRNLNEFLDRHPLPQLLDRTVAVLVLAGTIFFVFDAANGTFYPRIRSVREPGLGVMEGYYPIGAADWILAERPPGPISHHMADGGYLIWRLYPDYPVMVDGRLEVFGAERFAELQMWGAERLRALDEKYHFGVIIHHHSLVGADELLYWLHLNSNWRLTFVDDAAAVFVRVDAAGRTWPDLDVDSPDLFPPFTGGAGASDLLQRRSRTNFYMAMKRHARALEIWEGTLERYPGLEQGDIIHATLLARTGKGAAAETILRRLVAESPGDATLLAQVGDLRFGAGDLVAAREHYEDALRLLPGFAYARLRLGILAEAEGQIIEATEWYQQVLATTPDMDAVAIQARHRLRALGTTF